ncbi:hypothetical protein [Dongia rigui]|uniref:Uncharacterized protein n=1 Tax=Dongia rigui TaxID=940149 RepID=A0ABU5DTL2_9PROT|nr:hypothetical protein [Dongia rigui]MDY0870350.1 hypothetical protein [Dongia rigui]
MSIREIDLSRKHIAVLRGLILNPAHAPIDGMCLDELRMMALIQPVGGGYALTAAGHEKLQAELMAADMREQTWSAGAAVAAE